MAESVVRLLEDHSKSGVYQILNTVNGKRYVGSAVDFRRRWNSHKNKANQGLHHNRHFQSAWLTYGENAFVFSVLEYTSRCNAVLVEQKYIDTFHATDGDYGYNMSPAAGSQLGFKKTAESIEKSASAIRGRKRSAEAVEKTAAAHRGTKRSEAVRQKISEAASRRKRGRHSLETRRKISQWQIGRKMSPEAIEKMAATKRGVKRSDESRRKQSETMTGRKMPEATREAVSKALKCVRKSRDAVEKMAASKRGKPHKSKLRIPLNGQKTLFAIADI